MQTEQWHAERRLGIGGSDAAAALGLSKWKTPYQLYLEKIGEAEPQNETWDMARGKVMEPLLRQHFADTFGVEVLTTNHAVVSEAHPFMRYNPDGITADGVLAEFKTARYVEGWGQAGTDEVPQDYLIQCQHGLIVLGLEVARPSVSIGFAEPVYYEVPADKHLQQMIIENEHDFWQRVVNREAPPPTSNDDVAMMYRNVNGAAIMATPEIEQYFAALKMTRATMKDCEADKERFEVIIKQFMGENETLLGANGLPLATWKQQAGAKRVDADALRKAHPDIAAAVTKQGEPTRRFLLK